MRRALLDVPVITLSLAFAEDVVVAGTGPFKRTTRTHDAR